MPNIEPMHAARLAQLEGALLALLCHAQDEGADVPDAITAELGPAGLDLTFWRGGQPVGGEGL